MEQEELFISVSGGETLWVINQQMNGIPWSKKLTFKLLQHQGMASSGNSAVILRLQILILSISCALICYSRLSTASPAHNQRLICWQAIMKCQREPECHYAYTQYLHACGPVINGNRKKCPSHCISSIIQLNLTVNGPALEDCECASDTLCKMTKRAIEPCMPRTSHMGCTEARKLCEKDPECSTAMRDYLYHCRKRSGYCRNLGSLRAGTRHHGDFSVMGTSSLQPFLKSYWLTPVKWLANCRKACKYGELETV